ncbi:hypothetical protein [Actinoplanes sp. NPDC049681]|uniref:hypothetical protein n=1 Tax=Actinoplanes sp. NPDC049681 TaxID=3363905 RepID=UPI00379E40C1
MPGAVIGIAPIGGPADGAVTGPLARRFGIGPLLVLGYVASRRRRCAPLSTLALL